MAEAKKPAPAADAGDSAPKAKKNTLMYVVVILLVLMIVVLGAGTFVLYKIFVPPSLDEPVAESTADGHGAADAAKDKKKKEKKKSEHGEAPVFTKLDTFTVNLANGSVLQTEIHVQVVDEKQSELIKSYLPRLSSQVNLLLSSKKQEEVSSLEGKVKLMEEIKQTLNKVLGAKEDEEGVMSVELKTFIIQ